MNCSLHVPFTTQMELPCFSFKVIVIGGMENQNIFTDTKDCEIPQVSLEHTSEGFSKSECKRSSEGYRYYLSLSGSRFSLGDGVRVSFDRPRSPLFGIDIAKKRKESYGSVQGADEDDSLYAFHSVIPNLRPSYSSVTLLLLPFLTCCSKRQVGCYRSFLQQHKTNTGSNSFKVCTLLLEARGQGQCQDHI
jgi:hypothetical protein